MEMTVLTLTYDQTRKGFAAEELEDFCLNKKIHEIQGHFFVHEGMPHWSVLISYEKQVKPEPALARLNETEKLAYQRLREWRRERSNDLGYPAYLVASNRQLAEMIRRRASSLQAFQGIKGFGRKRIEKYGKDIIHILQHFFENEQK